MIYTPVYNIAAVREYELRKKHLSWVYYLLRMQPIVSVLKRIYTKRHGTYYRNVYDYSDAVVLLNETMRDEFLEIIDGGREVEKTYVIPNTLNGSFDATVRNKEKIVLWVGKMDTSIKRPDLMLRIWQKVESIHPEWKLMMLGKGSGTGGAVLEEMKGLAKKLNLKNVSFEGQVDTRPYYERSEIVCVTSAHESFSLVLAEGLSYGVVPMAFKSFPTSMQLINDGVNGVLVKPFNIDEYARQLSSLMSNNGARNRLREKRHVTLKGISPEVVYAKWYSLFMEVTAVK